MEWKFKKNEKLNKVILIILAGVLLLVIAMPFQTTDTSTGTSESESVPSVDSYEARLKNLLSDTYGDDMVDVMIYSGSDSGSTSYYGVTQENQITGVLITIREAAVSDTTISDITLAVCALFDLPAHKVAVLVKK